MLLRFAPVHESMHRFYLPEIIGPLYMAMHAFLSLLMRPTRYYLMTGLPSSRNMMFDPGLGQSPLHREPWRSHLQTTCPSANPGQLQCVVPHSPELRSGPSSLPSGAIRAWLKRAQYQTRPSPPRKASVASQGDVQQNRALCARGKSR